ncbi:nucleolar complex protein 14 [Coemansia sp. RSA 1365]|nr:nucleolar complex protein 14 [Coemansia sp. RSA 1365]
MGKQNAIKRGSGNKQSALKKLRSALSTAGITGANSQPSKRELKRRRTGQQKDVDKIEIRRKKLQAIQSALNPFELQVNRKKLDILGLKRKDEVVNVAVARQKATERRKQTIGKERERKGRFGGIVDQRIGENDPTMDPEERMLRRFTVERQRKSERNTSLYNLEDDTDSDVEGGIASLTHFGQALGEMTDDFDPVPEDSGKMDVDSADDSDEQPARKKTKAEVMQEIIAKSKQHKHEQQQQREQDDGERQQLDDEFESVRGLLSFEDGPRDSDDDEPQQQRAYDAHVRELTFEMRARPQDRLLTEEEKARDELERLEKAERHRLRRMDGLPSDSEPESDDDALPYGRRGADRLPVADDLGDDFTTDAVDAAEDKDVGMLGAGLEGVPHSDEESDDEEEESSEDSDLSGDEESDDLSSVEEEDSVDAKVPAGDTQRVAADRKPVGGDSELPYTFPAPTDYAAWIELVGGYTPEQQLVVVRRLRTQYHIRLSPQNKQKLGNLAVILVDHLATLADKQHPTTSGAVLDELSAHIGQLASVDPEQFGEHCRQAVIGMHRRILADVRGNHNALKPSDCALMRLFVSVFSSSDRYHAVVTPMLVAIGQYLSQHVFSSLADVAAGLVLAAVVHESQRLSRRLVPEALNFIYAMMSAVVCDPADPADWSDGPYPLSRRQRDALKLLRLGKNDAGENEATVDSVHWSWLSEHSCDHLSSAKQYGILKACLLLMRRFIDCYFALPAFVECFAPLSPLLTKISQRLPLHFRLQQQQSGGSAPTEIRTLLSNLQNHLEEMLSQSLAKREPLRLQYHRPLAIESVAPKFESSYNLDHHYDTDRNRNEIVKLRRQVARERRGAVRELRRDAQFIAGQRLDEQLAKDKLYTDKMKKAWSVLEADQSQLKKLDKLKIKERKAKVSS